MVFEEIIEVSFKWRFANCGVTYHDDDAFLFFHVCLLFFCLTFCKTHSNNAFLSFSYLHRKILQYQNNYWSVWWHKILGVPMTFLSICSCNLKKKWLPLLFELSILYVKMTLLKMVADRFLKCCCYTYP